MWQEFREIYVEQDVPKTCTKVRYRIGHIRPFGKSILEVSVCKD